MRLTALALLLSSASVSAEPLPADCLDRTMATSIQGVAASRGISLALLRLQDGAEWTWTAGDIGDADATALGAQHAFRIASNTKTFTAAAVLRLIEQGRLGLDDPLQSRLSAEEAAALQSAGYDTAAITLRHLLNHTSGLREHVDEAYLQRSAAPERKQWTAQEQVERAMRAGPPLAAPGAEFHYSDTGYILLGNLIERSTGEPLPQALRELLDWPRLGLRQTWTEVREPDRAARVHQHWNGQDTYDWHASFDLYGGGGLVATPLDLARFTRALLRDEVFDDPASLQTMRTPGREDSWNGYGAGLFTLVVDGEPLLGHSGFWNSFAFASLQQGVVYAGATVEKTGTPYAELLATMRTAWQDCSRRAGPASATPANGARR